MDLEDLSLNSVENDQHTKGNSSMIQESDNDGIHLQISIDETSTQSNSQSLQKYDETGHSPEVAKGSRSKNESLNVQEGRSSICTIGKGSASNSSLMVGTENLKTSQFHMLSFTSTDATCGSSSADSISSDDELLDDLTEVSERCESEDVSNLEQPVLALPGTAVKNISISPSTAFVSGIDLDNESQTIDCALTGADGSSRQENYNSMKSPEISNSLDAVGLPSLYKGRLSNFKSKEYLSKMHFSRTLPSDKHSDIGKQSSNKNTMIVPPLLRKAPSLNTREDETSEIFSDCGETGGFYDHDSNRKNYCQKKDTSVRRKVKPEPPPSSKTNFLPNLSSTPSVFSASRKIGRSLQQISKSVEQTSEQGDDTDIYETYGKSGKVSFVPPKPWVKELISCYQTKNADTTPRVDTEGLLKEVQYFFQNNRLAADENLSWKQNKYRIAISRYFSDEFSRSHGLLSFEGLVKKFLMRLERYTFPYLRNELELLELCKTLMECNVSEEAFIDYFKIRFRDGGCDMELIPSNREHRNKNVNRRLFSIEIEFGFHVMLELYKKLTREGALFLSILHESKKPSAAEERFRCRELLTISENASQVPDEFSSGNPSTIYTDYLPLNPTLSQNESSNIDCPLSNEGNVPQNDESTTELFQTQSSESRETSSVLSVSDSQALESSEPAENESSNENTPLSANKAA